MDLFSLVAKLTLDKNEFERDLDEAERDLGGIDVPDTKLELDNDEFNGALEESQGLGDTFGTEMEGVFNGIKTALTVTGIVGAIAGIVNGLKEAVNMTAETADGIDKGSKKLGISTKAYQEWDHALKQSGSSIDVVKKGIMQFQAAIKAADPSTPFADAEDQVDGLADKTAGLSSDAYEALRELGLLSRLQAGEFQNAEELMNASLLALAGFEGSTDERGILTRKLFGRGGDELNALLDEGTEGVKALLTEASDLGLIMSDDEITNAVAYGDAVANLNAELDAIKTAFVKDIIPQLTSATKWLTNFLTGLNPRLQEQNIFTIFDEIDKRTLTASLEIDEATVTAKKLIEDLQTMGDYWTLDDEGRMAWDALAAKALELFPQLSDYIDRDGKKIQGNTKDIEENIEAWARLQKERILSDAMDEKRAAVATQLSNAYKKGAEARKKEAEAEGKWQTALEKINKIRKEQGLEEFAEGTTYEQYREWYNEYGQGTTSVGAAKKKRLTDYADATKEYETVIGQAEDLREEAEKLKDTAKQAQDELADQQKYLEEEMGLTADRLREAQREAEEYYKVLSKIPRHINTRVGFDGLTEHTHAIGSAYIPYDNYPALLHRGERVLTATEARQGGGEIDYTALEDKIIAAIRQGMDGATVRSYINGKLVTDEVNRNNMQGVKGRRYRP